MKRNRLLTLAVLASLALPSTVASGSSSLALRAPAGLSLTPSWIAESNVEFAGFGFSVNTAGDVNGDGYADVIVGARGYSNGQTDEGRAYAYYGSANGLSLEPNWSSESNQAWSWYAMIVGTAGDVNGDGYDDAIVGGVRYDHPEPDEGAAFVFYGSPNGLSPTANWMGESNQAGALYGRYVSTAGDVNGDGYADIIVGAPKYDNNGRDDVGRAYVYYGSRTGLSQTANWIGEGTQPQDSYGDSVGAAGDINGDGYDDIIVGAWNYSNGQQSEGRAYVYYGSPNGPSQTPSWVAESNQAYASYGFCVTRAGDVNLDGYGDVLISANHWTNGQHQEGATFLYYGSPAGLGTNAGWMFEADQGHAHSGTACSTAGDVNGDGYDDIAVGSYHYSNTIRSQGRVWVFYGSAAGLSPTPNWINESDQQDCLYGIGVGAAGDVNRDGYDDLLVGAYDYHNGQRREGRAFEYNGGPDR